MIVIIVIATALTTATVTFQFISDVKRLRRIIANNIIEHGIVSHKGIIYSFTPNGTHLPSIKIL